MLARFKTVMSVDDYVSDRVGAGARPVNKQRVAKARKLLSDLCARRGTTKQPTKGKKS